MFTEDQEIFCAKLKTALKIKNGQDSTNDEILSWLDDFDCYAIDPLLNALQCAMRETQGRLTPDKLFNFLPDPSAHPLPEQAWNAMPKSEGESGYVTEQMLAAYSACTASLEEGNLIAARMAFIETYKRVVAEAKSMRQQAKFVFSGGFGMSHDEKTRMKERAVLEAQSRGWITNDKAQEEMELLSNEKSNEVPAKVLQALKDETYRRDLKLLEGGEPKTPKDHLNAIRQTIDKAQDRELSKARINVKPCNDKSPLQNENEILSAVAHYKTKGE